jgi:anti-sigma B factor antagonist
MIRPLNRVRVGAAASNGEAKRGSDGAVITTEHLPLEPVPRGAVPKQPAQPEPETTQPEPAQAEMAQQLELSCQTGVDGYQVIQMSGELDIATAEKAYSYISEVIDGRPAPVTVDLSGLTFCDASGLGVLARIARHARQAGRQLKLTSVRPPLVKLIRLTGLDGVFPELRAPVHAYST